MMFTGNDGLTSSLNAFILCIGQESQLMVCLSSSPFCISQSVNEKRILVEAETADMKVFNATKGLDAIKCISGQLTLTQKVML